MSSVSTIGLTQRDVEVIEEIKENLEKQTRTNLDEIKQSTIVRQALQNMKDAISGGSQ